MFSCCLKSCSDPSVQMLLEKLWLIRSVPIQFSKRLQGELLRCNNIFLWCTSVLGISKLKHVISAPCLQYYLGHSRIKNKIVKTKLIAQVLLSASDACLHFSNAVFMSLRKICCLLPTVQCCTVLLCYLCFYFNTSMLFHWLQKDPSSAPGLSFQTCLVSPQMTRWKLW